MAATAASTRAMVSSLTGAERLITADTVEIATPARFATSLMVDTAPPCDRLLPCAISETLRACKTPLRRPERALRAESWLRENETFRPAGPAKLKTALGRSA